MVRRLKIGRLVLVLAAAAVVGVLILCGPVANVNAPNSPAAGWVFAPFFPLATGPHKINTPTTAAAANTRTKRPIFNRRTIIADSSY